MVILKINIILIRRRHVWSSYRPQRKSLRLISYFEISDFLKTVHTNKCDVGVYVSYFLYLRECSTLYVEIYCENLKVNISDLSCLTLTCHSTVKKEPKTIRPWNVTKIFYKNLTRYWLMLCIGTNLSGVPVTQNLYLASW